MHPEAWYQQMGIELMLNLKVIGLKPQSKEVLLLDGQVCGYDKLILATGSYSYVSPTKGADLDVVETLWTMNNRWYGLWMVAGQKGVSRVRTPLAATGNT